MHQLSPYTRKVLSALRGNGLEANLACGQDSMSLNILDRYRSAETSFGFDQFNESETMHEIAEQYLTSDQRMAIYGEAEELLGA
jgi:hypothetical protein